jgi:flagellar M-ring protein FliF
MGFLQKIRAIWQRLGIIQQALLIAVVLTFAIVGWLLVHWARKPDMRMLYQQLSPEEAAKIVEKIAEAGVPYELRDGGTSIYAPKEKIYQLRLDMAKEGLPEGEQGGYRIFDKEKIGISPFVQNVNLKRALQDELSKSIQIIEGVVYARVHIVSGEQNLLASDAVKTTASVVVRLKPGYRLSTQTIAAITHLIAGSVDGLKSENVTIIDSQGNLLSGQSDQMMAGAMGSTVQDYRERVEQSLTRKIEDMLTAVLGPGRAAVGVSAIIDTNSVSTVTETYDPSAKVASKEEIKSGTQTESSPAAAAGTPAGTGNTKKDDTVVTEYEVGKTVKQSVVLPGEIKSLSVSAFVDLSRADANQAGGVGGSGTIMDVNEVEQIIRNAVGLRTTDSLKVVNAKFYRPVELLTEEEQSNWSRYIAIARHASLGIMAICAMLVLRILRGGKKKVEAAAVLQQLPAGTGVMGFLPAEAGKSETMMLRRQIASSLQRNPEQVKQLFASWIQEKAD